MYFSPDLMAIALRSEIIQIANWVDLSPCSLCILRDGCLGFWLKRRNCLTSADRRCGFLRVSLRDFFLKESVNSKFIDY